MTNNSNFAANSDEINSMETNINDIIIINTLKHSVAQYEIKSYVVVPLKSCGAKKKKRSGRD
jgi:hypothetical protein